MILLLAGLQAMPKEVLEAAKVDGAGPWQSFWQITFPLMLPVSDHRDRPPHHLQAEARRHRHHRHLGRPGRRDRHGVELHLSRVPRPLECRLRHHAGDGLPDHDHRLRHPAAEARQQAHAEDDLMTAMQHRGHSTATARGTRATGGTSAASAASRSTRALIFWAFVSLFPVYWTITTSFKVAVDVQRGPPDPLGRFHARLDGLALARPLARHHLRDLDRARRVPQALPQQHRHRRRRLAARGADRLARRLSA